MALLAAAAVAEAVPRAAAGGSADRPMRAAPRTQQNCKASASGWRLLLSASLLLLVCGGADDPPAGSSSVINFLSTTSLRPCAGLLLRRCGAPAASAPSALHRSRRRTRGRQAKPPAQGRLAPLAPPRRCAQNTAPSLNPLHRNVALVHSLWSQ